MLIFLAIYFAIAIGVLWLYDRTKLIKRIRSDSELIKRLTGSLERLHSVEGNLKSQRDQSIEEIRRLRAIESLEEDSLKSVVLVTDNGLLIEQSYEKNYLKRSLKRHRVDMDFYEYIICPFYAEILEFEPTTGQVIKWKKGKGFSMWRTCKECSA